MYITGAHKLIVIYSVYSHGIIYCFNLKYKKKQARTSRQHQENKKEYSGPAQTFAPDVLCAVNGSLKTERVRPEYVKARPPDTSDAPPLDNIVVRLP